MSGELVGRVIAHAPDNDPPLWALLVVIAEDMHSPTDTALMSRAELARRTRRSDSTIKRAIGRAIAGGWVKHWPGGGQGVASRYALDLARFPQATKGVTVTQYPEAEGGQGDPVSALKGVTVTSKGGHSDPVHRDRKNPSSSRAAPDDPLPVVVGVANADDDEARTALEGLPGVYPTPALLAALGVALRDRGHTAISVNKFLRETCSGGGERPGAVALVNLRAIPANVAPVPDRPDWCGECDERTRLLDPNADIAERCPRCHPRASAPKKKNQRPKGDPSPPAPARDWHAPEDWTAHFARGLKLKVAK